MRRVFLGLVCLAPLSWYGPQAAVAAGDGDALVIVNGQPISRARVVDLLMETRGLEIVQQLVSLELARQETRRRGISVTEADIQQQFRQALDEIVPQTDAQGVTLDEEGKRRALETILQQRCLTMPEFMLAMERNAHLRKLVEADFQVEEATLREEFARRYGEKVEVRHVQIDATDSRSLHEALDLLSRKVDFADVARRLSVNSQTAPRGGLMEPFSFRDEQIPAALREVAFSLAPGEVSAPTLAGKFIHILKLERRIPPADVRFEDVRDEVEQTLRQRVTRQRMNELITRLFQQAQVRVLDKGLRQKYEELRKSWTEGPTLLP
jgi:parvulin-like peptidyl-prolyl isomerase